MKTSHGYSFFFSARDALSNWHPARFEIDGNKFVCVEQYMMFAKAMLFKDVPVAEKILRTADPKEQKALGRQVHGFDEATWVANREAVLFRGCLAKFEQNPSLREVLIATGGNELVEASPYDRIWGVGLSMDDPLILNKTQWRGQNLLGQVLGSVRQHLLDLSKKAEQETARKPGTIDFKKLPDPKHMEAARAEREERRQYEMLVRKRGTAFDLVMQNDCVYGRLAPQERSFVASAHSRFLSSGGNLSDKQEKWIFDIASRNGVMFAHRAGTYAIRDGGRFVVQDGPGGGDRHVFDDAETLVEWANDNNVEEEDLRAVLDHFDASYSIRWRP